MLMQENEDGDLIRCELDKPALIRRPIWLIFEVPPPEKPVGLYRFETSLVLNRKCAIYHPGVGVHGAWDTYGIQTISVTDNMISCVATRPGSYGIIAEMDVPPEYPGHWIWVSIYKVVGYDISIPLLAILLVAAARRRQPWDMAHKLIFNTVLLQLLLLLCTGLSEADFIRSNRIHCTHIGLAINFLAVAEASLLAMACFAIFRQVITSS